MDLRAVGMTMDATDVGRLADFWQAALGYQRREGGAGGVTLSDSSLGRVPNHLSIQAVPEPKTAKHRLHLDLFPADVGAAVAELVALGATMLQAPDYDSEGHLGFYATILADPEGGEFCVVGRKPKA